MQYLSFLSVCIIALACCHVSVFLRRVSVYFVIWHIYCLVFFFFFQAEDGIRDDLVTGVQTCALPILRRAAPPVPGGNGGPPPERFGDVEVIPASRTVLRGGQPVPLTPKEFDLLVALLRRRGAVVTRLDLLREVWGYSAEVLSRTVDTHVAELRRKLETDPAAPRHILTVRKSGYRLER